MYQFMVATTRNGSSFVSDGTGNANAIVTAGGGETSTMSITSGANKWASRAVVALQLAAWSAVGIVLLEKGVASLQRNRLANDISTNATQQMPPRSEDVLSVIPLVPIIMDNGSATHDVSRSQEDSVSEDFLWSETTEAPSTRERSSKVSDGDANEHSTKDESKSERLDPKAASTENETKPTWRASGPGNTIEIGGKPSIVRKTDRESEFSKNSHESRINEDKGRESDPATIKVILESEDSSEWSLNNRKRVRFAQFNNTSGGAAAAVAMVAVGAIMLVLGPAVIVLRALDERRQERRFLKLSGEEDLPPSYEQATGSIEQAPTYSSLNLDAIPPLISNNSGTREVV